MLKKIAFFLLLLPLSTDLLRGQSDPNFCAEIVAKAKVALQQTDYDDARTFCESALNICPASGDTLQTILKRIAKAIDDEKKQAQKNARIAENNATASSNPTLAARMLEYNIQKDPNNRASVVNFYKVFNDDSRAFYRRDFIGHADAVTAVSLSSDGKRVLTGSGDNTAKLWDAETGKVLRDFIGHASYVEAVSLSSDGKRVLTGSRDNTAKWWCLALDCGEQPFAAPLSLYEMKKEGLALEPEDTAQYLRDSLAFAEKIRRNTLEYQRLMRKWKTSAAYQLHQQKIKDWNNSEEAKQHKAKIEAFLKSTEKSGESTDIITKLENDISNSTDTTEIYGLYQTLIDTLQARFDSDKSYRASLAEAYGNQAWYALFLKKFAAAEAAGLKGLSIDPSQIFIKTNLGHALLFQDKYDEALKVYQDYAKSPPQYDGETNVQVLLEDFEALESAGISHKDLPKIKAALKAMEKRE
jgi:Tfp pilus assembly protein PilF